MTRYSRARIGKRQIAIDIPEKWYLEIQEHAEDQYMTMKDWIILAMVEQIKKEKKLGF